MTAPRHAGLAFRQTSFLAALIHDSDPPGPPDVFAGLAVLRLVEGAVRSEFAIAGPDSIAVGTARTAIACLDPSLPQTTDLRRIVNAIHDGAQTGVTPILPMLLAYAATLEATGQLALAVDVCDTMIAVSSEVDEPDLHSAAWVQVAGCQLALSNHSSASSAYATAHAIAEWRRDTDGAAVADIGLAKITRARGNLPAADKELGSIARRCLREGRRMRAAHALHERAITANERGDAARALGLTFQAFGLCDSAGPRERMLADIAVYFIHLERFDAARDALTVQERSASRDIILRAAQINLVAIAARTGDAPLFDEYRRRLSGVQLSPLYEANFLIEAARGCHQLGRKSEIGEILGRARQLASAHQLNRITIQLDQLELDLQKKPARVPEPEELAAPVARVERAIRKLARSLAS